MTLFRRLVAARAGASPKAESWEPAAQVRVGRRVCGWHALLAYLAEFPMGTESAPVRVIFLDDDGVLRGDIHFDRSMFSFGDLGLKIANFAYSIGASAFFILHAAERYAEPVDTDWLLAHEVRREAGRLDITMLDYLVAAPSEFYSLLFQRASSIAPASATRVFS